MLKAFTKCKMENNSYRGSQGKAICNDAELRRNPNDIQMTSQYIDNGNQNVANLLLSGSQGPSANHLLGYQSASFGSFYSSPGFNNSLSGYENNLQWLTDNRIQNQQNQITGSLISDKAINSTTQSLPPTTSHSCCVNRFGVPDSLAMGSPIPGEQNKSTCDVSTFQNKSNFTMNMIDPIQSWLNLQIPNNQQYCKYGERSMNQNCNIPVPMPSQMTLPVIDQSDLKQNDMCIQSPDTCFENVNTTTSVLKQIDNSVANNLKQNTIPVENKQNMISENGVMSKQQNTYQSSLMSKDWKSTFQSMQNYIPSPNMFNTVNESQENFLFPQYNLPPANSYYSTPDNYSSYMNKNNACMSQSKTNLSHRDTNITINNQFPDQNQPKLNVNPKIQLVSAQYIPKSISETGRPTIHIIPKSNNNPNFNSLLSDCCQANTLKGSSNNLVDNNRLGLGDSGHENKSGGTHIAASLEIDNRSKSNYKTPEASDSDESNIIVEESDEIGEIDSEISIEEIKKSYQANTPSSNEVLLRCLVCNTSSQTATSNFFHMNESFPLTTTLNIPVRTKLEQLLPMDFQDFLKLHNSFMCHRCLNLVDTVELLEVKLVSSKKIISDTFLKTIQQLMPEADKLLQDKSKISNSLCGDKSHNIDDSFVELEVENECSEEAQMSDSDVTRDFQCSYCSKILSSKKTFKLHLQHHTKEFSFYCERCGKGFPLKSDLERHLHWHNGTFQNVQMLCEICGEYFSSKNSFYSHQLKVHSANNNFKCTTCGKGFSRKVSLEIHSHKHMGRRKFICEYCGYTFTSESNLRSHIKICTKDLIHKCDTCGNSFATKGQLSKHNMMHSDIYKLTCSVCNKGFYKSSDLKYHMLSHSSERQYKCTECEKAFKTVFNLNYHLKVVHKQEKVFKCAVCGKIFGQQNLLSDHMNSHSKERPYKCSQCDSSFAHQSTFITHLKTHTNKVKLKTCQVCGKSIKTRMSVHMRTHTGEKPYKCTYCPLAFTVNVSLKKHVELKHRKT